MREKIISIPTRDEFKRVAQDNKVEQAFIENGGVPEGYVVVDEKGKELEPLVDSPALNRRLLKMARKSFNEIAYETGMPAEEVAERLATLLDDKGWRDDLMEEKLLLAEVAMLVDDIRERMSRVNLEDEAFMSGARVQLQAFKTLLEQVDKRRKAVDGKLALVSQLQAQMLADAIRLNNQLTVESLARKYDLDEEVVYAEWEENFPKAIEMLEKNTHGA